MKFQKMIMMIGLTAILTGIVGCSSKEEVVPTNENTTQIQEQTIKPTNESSAKEVIVDLNEIVEKPLGEFEPLSVTTLTPEQRTFVETVSKRAGLYSEGDLVIFSLGQKYESGYGIEFVKQEENENRVRLYVKLSKPGEADLTTQAVTYSYIVGKMVLPAIANVGFYNIDTNEEIKLN
jgi:hypothetical protein